MPLPESSNITISLSGDDEAELRGYWDGLAEGGSVAVPLEAAPWGASFGQLTDKYGVVQRGTDDQIAVAVAVEVGRGDGRPEPILRLGDAADAGRPLGDHAPGSSPTRPSLSPYSTTTRPASV